MPVKPKSWGYVYVVRSLDRYKIGYSGDLRTLENRMNRLRTMNAFEIEPVVFLRSRFAHNVETRLQRQFAEKHAHDEWYDLTEDDVNWIVRTFYSQVYDHPNIGTEGLERLFNSGQ